MSDQSRGTLPLRAFRLWLIKNGFPEREADTVIQEISAELTTAVTGPKESREAISQKIARYLAQKRLGQSATSEEIKRLAIIPFTTAYN
jgi:hypothetical protein